MLALSSVWSAYRSWRTHPHSGRTTMQKGKHKRIILEALNVRTLLNRAITSRPERGTALVTRELYRYRVDIAALSETRIADEGSLREDGSDYTFFWKGKPQAEDRIHGFGFAIRTALLRSMPVLPVGNNERLMKTAHPSQQDQIPHNYQRLRPYTYKPRWCPRNNFMNSLTKSSGQPHRATN